MSYLPICNDIESHRGIEHGIAIVTFVTSQDQTVPLDMAPRRASWLAWLHHLYWVAVFVIYPLLLSPQTFLSQSVAGLATNAGFRALTCLALLLFGIVILALSHRELRLASLGRAMWKARTPIQIMYLTIGLVLLSTAFTNLAPVVPGLGSQARFDGTLVQAAWFGLYIVSCGLGATRTVGSRTLARYTILGGLLTAVWVLLQASGQDPLRLLTRAHVVLTYPAGAFGHGGLAAGHLALVLVIAVGMFVGSRNVTRWAWSSSAF